jgi:hypothetical protein
VVVGDGISIGGDEETGALPGHGMIVRLALAVRRVVAERHAEAAEETLHRRARRERRIAIEIHHLCAVDLDAHRNDGRLHLVHDIGEARHPLRVLSSLDRRELGKLDLHPGAGEHRSRREAGDGRQEHDAARVENASRLVDGGDLRRDDSPHLDRRHQWCHGERLDAYHRITGGWRHN